jgi:hemoglobin
MAISRAQFNSVVEDLIRAMEAESVPVAAQNRLLARLAAMYPEIAGQ